MYSVEYIDSLESVKTLYDDSLFSELFEYLAPVSLQSIDTKRASSLVRKGIENSLIIVTKDSF